MWLLLFYSCSDKGVIAYNSIPEISIQSHSNGANLIAGTHSFRAQVSDANHGTSDLEVRWFVGETEVCSWENPELSGESLCRISLIEGTHRIIAEVRDAEQAGAHAEVEVLVQGEEIIEEVPDAPSVNVVSPTNDSIYFAGDIVPLQAIISYTGEMLSLNFTWSSHIDGSFPVTLDESGLVVGEIALSEGTHSLTFLIIDENGAFTTDVRTVFVLPFDGAPEITPFSLEPQPVYTNDILSASITAHDPEQDEVVLEAIWKVDGVDVNTEVLLGYNANFSLDGAQYFQKNQRVSLEITASDGQNSTIQMAEILVSNTEPTPPGIVFVQQDALQITQARAGIDDIQCAIDIPSADVDGDSISYSVQWEESGVLWTSSALSTIYPNDTIPSFELVSGQVFTCTMVPNDGEADGIGSSLSIDVLEVPFIATIDTYNYNGMTNYPLNLDQCTPASGMCCQPTTTQEQMDAFCQLAGYSIAVSWVVQTLASTNCYCWGGCSNFTWHSNCCSGQSNRNFVTSVDCQ